MQYLQSIPGIGFVVAVSILGKIGDPDGTGGTAKRSLTAALTQSEGVGSIIFPLSIFRL